MVTASIGAATTPSASRPPLLREEGKKLRHAAVVLAASLLAGCVVGPDFMRPKVDSPDAWRVSYKEAADVANTKWWEQFGDPALNQLIETALAENRDVRIAAARVEQLATPEIPAGLPSTLLERRPDILQAEQELVAANAQIGAAKALYFPTISITGLLGSASATMGNFLTGPAAAGTLAAGLAGPIFTFGAIEGQVATAEAGQRAALAFYEQVVLNAFREVNDALIGTQKKELEFAAQARRTVALREFARLSRLKFDNGYAGYLEVLYAENELFSAELVAVQTQFDRYVQLINVYKSMGGGWVDEAAKLAPAPQLVGTGASAKPDGGTATR